MNDKFKGLIYGAVAAATYGMNPLFALPLYKEGLTADSVLFYRYALAVAMLGITMLIRKTPFAVSGKMLLLLLGGGAADRIIFALSVSLLQLYGRGNCIDYSVRLSRHGRGDHGGLFP